MLELIWGLRVEEEIYKDKLPLSLFSLERSL